MPVAFCPNLHLISFGRPIAFTIEQLACEFHSRITSRVLADIGCLPLSGRPRWTTTDQARALAAIPAVILYLRRAACGGLEASDRPRSVTMVERVWEIGN